jgi:hypothetical protein
VTGHFLPHAPAAKTASHFAILDDLLYPTGSAKMHRNVLLKQGGQFARKREEKLKANRQQKTNRGKADNGDKIGIFNYGETVVPYAYGVRGGHSNGDICRHV